VSRSTVENQYATGLYLRAPPAKSLRVADPRSVARGQIKTPPPGRHYFNNISLSVLFVGSQLLACTRRAAWRK
jgi:hypothetical protein